MDRGTRRRLEEHASRGHASQKEDSSPREHPLAPKSHSLHNRCYMQLSEIAPPGQDQLVDAVLNASRVLVAIAARSLADVGEEVTLTQYRSLVVLASRGPQGVAALAEAVSVAPPTASRMCDRLVKKGLVTRPDRPA